MSKCPNCGNEATKIVKEWNYSIFHVKNFNCTTCQKNFKAYFKQGKFSHIIDSTQRKPIYSVIQYLKKHDSARAEEIAEAENLSVAEVIKMLEELEKKGIVESITT